MNAKSTLRGFTLTELMITVAIAAIVMSIAAPSLRNTMQEGRLVSQTNVISSAINYAQSEAIKSQTATHFCGSTDQTNCNTANYESGWIVFTDLDGNGAPGGAINGIPEVKRVGQSLDQNSIRLSGAALATILSFDDEGMIATEATFSICDERGVTDANAIVINISGQGRIAVDEDDPLDNTVNIHDGSNVACP